VLATVEKRNVGGFTILMTLSRLAGLNTEISPPQSGLLQRIGRDDKMVPGGDLNQRHLQKVDARENLNAIRVETVEFLNGCPDAGKQCPKDLDGFVPPAVLRWCGGSTEAIVRELT